MLMSSMTIKRPSLQMGQPCGSSTLVVLSSGFGEAGEAGRQAEEHIREISQRSGLRVHARAGLPCPVCGDTVKSVSFADRSFQYCPTCQTEGRELADRRLSKLLK